jgi:hypothetical protein
MVTGFSLVFCVVVAITLLFFGAIWKSSSPLNVMVKAANFMGVFASVYVAARCSELPVLYLCGVAIWFLLGGLIWEAEDFPNLCVKIGLFFVSTLAAFAILVH